MKALFRAETLNNAVSNQKQGLEPPGWAIGNSGRISSGLAGWLGWSVRPELKMLNKEWIIEKEKHTAASVPQNYRQLSVNTCD